MPMPKDYHLYPAAQHCLEIWASYVVIVKEYTDWVMLCPNVHTGIFTINVICHTLHQVLNKDDVAVLLADTHSMTK